MVDTIGINFFEGGSLYRGSKCRLWINGKSLSPWQELPVRTLANCPDDIIRRVGKTKAYISFKGKLWKVPRAFQGEKLAIRPLNIEGRYTINFATTPIAEIDLNDGK
jgi:hypothetical protein